MGMEVVGRRESLLVGPALRPGWTELCWGDSISIPTRPTAWLKPQSCHSHSQQRKKKRNPAAAANRRRKQRSKVLGTRDEDGSGVEKRLDSLRRYRETLRWETECLRSEVTSRGLETIAGKKGYLKKHSAPRSLSLELPQLKEQLSGQKIASLPVVSLPYLVPHHEEALDLLLHEAHKLGYRIQSLRELAAPISLETVRLVYLLSERCVEISRMIARQGSPNSGKSSADAAIAAYNERRVSWESIWGSPVLRSGGFNDISKCCFISPVIIYLVETNFKEFLKPQQVIRKLQF